jgi:hypothetical protein
MESIIAAETTESGSTRPLQRQEGGSHYKQLSIQPVEYIVANNMEYCEANVVKYVSRHNLKNGVEDIRKAIHYLQLILELKYGDT